MDHRSLALSKCQPAAIDGRTWGRLRDDSDAARLPLGAQAVSHPANSVRGPEVVCGLSRVAPGHFHPGGKAVDGDGEWQAAVGMERGPGQLSASRPNGGPL